MSDWLLSNLPDEQCGFYPNEAVVCCPKASPKVTVIKSTTEKPWIWEITKNVPDVPSKTSYNNNFEQSYERWDHTQFNKYIATTASPVKVIRGKPHSYYNNLKYSDDDYHYNLIDFEDPDTHKNCPPSFNDEFEMPFSDKPVHSSKHRSPIPTPKPNTSTSNRRGSIKPPSRRRFQNQGTQLNQVSAVQNQKVSSRQPVKRFVNSPLCGISVNTRIVGGREIAPGQFPWMARLAYRNRSKFVVLNWHFDLEKYPF